MTADKFLNQLYLNPDDSYFVLDYIDRLLNENNFSSCNEILAKLDLTKVPSHVRRMFLMATYPIKELLPARINVFEQALMLLEKEGKHYSLESLK